MSVGIWRNIFPYCYCCFFLLMRLFMQTYISMHDFNCNILSLKLCEVCSLPTILRPRGLINFIYWINHCHKFRSFSHSSSLWLSSFLSLTVSHYLFTLFLSLSLSSGLRRYFRRYRWLKLFRVDFKTFHAIQTQISSQICWVQSSFLRPSCKLRASIKLFSKEKKER